MKEKIYQIVDHDKKIVLFKTDSKKFAEIKLKKIQSMNPKGNFSIISLHPILEDLFKKFI